MSEVIPEEFRFDGKMFPDQEKESSHLPSKRSVIFT